MKNIYIILLSLLILVVAGCKSSNKKNESASSELTGYISLSGAFALYPMVVMWADEFRKENPGVKIDISAGGAGKGMADALSKMIDLGMVSREISPQEIEKGAWFVALTKDAVLPTINAGNPFLSELRVAGVSKENLKKLFVTGEIKTWEELIGKPAKTPIHVFTRSDACGAAAMWGTFLGSTQEDLTGTGVFGDPGVADAVKNDIYGLGFNNVNYVYDITSRNKFGKMEVLPVDFNGNGVIDKTENVYQTLDQINEAIVKGDYPSPPARDLYFVSKGKPEKKEVVAFIDWILTKGQKFVPQAGYVPLSEEKINAELSKIKL
jgi:phosphate transport system substrate-binding protein